MVGNGYGRRMEISEGVRVPEVFFAKYFAPKHHPSQIFVKLR